MVDVADWVGVVSTTTVGTVRVGSSAVDVATLIGVLCVGGVLGAVGSLVGIAVAANGISMLTCPIGGIISFRMTKDQRMCVAAGAGFANRHTTQTSDASSVVVMRC